MANTVKIAPDLYSNPPKTGIPGARYDYRSVSLATTDLITTQIIALGILPAGHRLMDYFFESGVLDTSTGLTVTIGVLNSYYGEQLAGTSGLRLTTGVTQAAAAYNSNSVTDTTASPVLVTGLNLLTADTASVRSGGRAAKTATLKFSTDIGIDTKFDRIIAVQFPAAPTAAQAGTIGLGLLVDEP
jgi:hypothetical protein